MMKNETVRRIQIGGTKRSSAGRCRPKVLHSSTLDAVEVLDGRAEVLDGVEPARTPGRVCVDRRPERRGKTSSFNRDFRAVPYRGAIRRDGATCGSHRSGASGPRRRWWIVRRHANRSATSVREYLDWRWSRATLNGSGN